MYIDINKTYIRTFGASMIVIDGFKYKFEDAIEGPGKPGRMH